MGNVTNVMLSFSILEKSYEDEETKYLVMDALNTWTKEQGIGIFQEVGKHAGGKKVFETDVHAIAFQQFEFDKLLMFVSTLPWLYPQHLQIFAQKPEVEDFILFQLQFDSRGGK